MSRNNTNILDYPLQIKYIKHDIVSNGILCHYGNFADDTYDE